MNVKKFIITCMIISLNMIVNGSFGLSAQIQFTPTEQFTNHNLETEAIGLYYPTYKVANIHNPNLHVENGFIFYDVQEHTSEGLIKIGSCTQQELTPEPLPIENGTQVVDLYGRLVKSILVFTPESEFPTDDTYGSYNETNNTATIGTTTFSNVVASSTSVPEGLTRIGSYPEKFAENVRATGPVTIYVYGQQDNINE